MVDRLFGKSIVLLFLALPTVMATLECILSNHFNGKPIENQPFDQLIMCEGWCGVGINRSDKGLDVKQGCGNRCTTVGTMQIQEAVGQNSIRCCNSPRCNIYASSSNIPQPIILLALLTVFSFSRAL